MINYLFDFRQGYQWDGGVHYFCTVLMAYFHGDLVYTVFPRQFFLQVDVGKAFGQCSFKLTGDGLAANIQDGQANQHLLDAIVESAEKGTWLSL